MRKSRSHWKDARKRMRIKSSLKQVAKMELRVASQPNTTMMMVLIQNQTKE